MKKLSLSLVCFLGACSSTSNYFYGKLDETMKTRASKDLACPADKVTLTQLPSKDQYEAKGCEKAVTYQVACSDQSLVSCHAQVIKGPEVVAK